MTRCLVLLFGAPARFRNVKHSRLLGLLINAVSRSVTGISSSNVRGGDLLSVPVDLVTAASEEAYVLTGPRSRWMLVDMGLPERSPTGARLTGQWPSLPRRRACGQRCLA